MIYDYKHTPFSKALLTGVFCGLVATLVSLLFSFIFKFTTGYTLSTIVNVPTIIFFSLSLLTVAGLVYNLFSSMKGGKVWFIILFAGATAFVIWKISGVNRTNDPVINREFRELVSGILLISGICAFFLIPYLYQNKKFESAVL